VWTDPLSDGHAMLHHQKIGQPLLEVCPCSCRLAERQLLALRLPHMWRRFFFFSRVQK
jgi:hypothetical protein